MTEQPQTSKGQDQVQVSSVQTNPVEVSILQTPLNVEKGKRREAEATTPSLDLHNSLRPRDRN